MIYNTTFDLQDFLWYFDIISHILACIDEVKHVWEIEQRDPLQFTQSIYYLCNNANSSSIYSSGMAGDALRPGGSGFA